MKRALIGAALLALLVVGLAASAVEPQSRALATVDLLARADADASGPRPSRRRLADNVRLLDRIGAHAEADAGDDPLPDWRKRAALGEPGYRGRVLGPAFRRGWIGPGETAAIAQQFLGGQKTTVAIAAAPERALDLRIDDPVAGAVCRAAGRSCSWLPLYTQRYTISVRNPGRDGVRFYLVVD